MVKKIKVSDFRTPEITISAFHEDSTDSIILDLSYKGRELNVCIAYEEWVMLVNEIHKQTEGDSDIYDVMEVN